PSEIDWPASVKSVHETSDIDQV
ncbi:uncharacterized protein METZ01_LOCUS378041, partial [marine metagenome]